MSGLTNQDSQYIQQIRQLASILLLVDDKSQATSEMWNSCFGGATRLQVGSFVGDNEGFVKADIEGAQNILTALHAWLDEGGYNRRVNLEKIRFISNQLGANLFPV
jgi:hypothetical protein